MVDSRPPRAELRRAAVPLDGTDPESTLHPDAAAMLREMAEDATLIALGEASHGARAQFRLKHRLIRHLVEECGVRAFALEEDANWIRQVDRYVTGGERDIERLLQHARINWPWKTSELVALLSWMRTFNEDRSARDQLRVYGFDISSFDRIAQSLLTFFDTVDDDISGMRGKLETLAEANVEPPIDLAASVQETLASLFDNHQHWEGQCSTEQVAFARRQVTLLRQALDLASVDDGNGFTVRDKAMADNASWVVEEVGSDKMVLWAHNVHVARAEQSNTLTDVPGRTMGDHLAARHGDAYVPVGIGLGGGEYLAMDAETMEPATPSVPEPPSGSIPDVFSRIGVVTPFVRTAALHERDRIATWLVAGPRRHRITGMIEDGKSLTYVASDLFEFDGFAFIERTEPIRHLGLDAPDA